MGDVIQFSKFRVNWVAIVKTTTTTTKMNREFNYNLDFFFLLKKHVNLQIHSGENKRGKTKTNYTE